MISIRDLIRHECPQFDFNSWLQTEETFTFILDLQAKLGCHIDLYQITDKDILLHPALATKLCSDLGDKALVWLAANYYQDNEVKLRRLQQQAINKAPLPLESVLANFCAG